jgi:cytochrome c oxidase subunit 4
MADTTHMSMEDVKKHVRVYMTVFGALAVLTVVTVGVAYLHLPIWPALIIALIIATIKGGLVASYFMHLISEKKVIYWVLVVTFVFLICMFLLFISAHHDQAMKTALVEQLRARHVA